MEIQNILIISALLVGLLEVVKRVGLPIKYIPAASLALGVGLCFIFGCVWNIAIIQGLILGLTAVGLYSGTKSTIKSIKK